jgi:hypothetical protein
MLGSTGIRAWTRTRSAGASGEDGGGGGGGGVGAVLSYAPKVQTHFKLVRRRGDFFVRLRRTSRNSPRIVPVISRRGYAVRPERI